MNNRLGRQMMAMRAVEVYLTSANGKAEKSVILQMIKNRGLETPPNNVIENLMKKHSTNNKVKASTSNKNKKTINPAVQALLAFGDVIEEQNQQVKEKDMEEQQLNQRIQTRRNTHLKKVSDMLSKD